MKTHFTLVFTALLLTTLAARAATDLNSAYAQLGFNPNAPGNAVVVIFSDVHMDLDGDSGITPGVVSTNFDPRLLTQLNTMSPAPQKILITGDLGTTYATAPGQYNDIDYDRTWAFNELTLFKEAVLTITNVAQTNILWVPGNHDQDPRETNAEYFRYMFPNMPTYQYLDLCGVRFIMLNGGNINFPYDQQTTWLKQVVANTSPTQTVAVLIHQPTLSSPEGNGPMLRDVFKDWPVPWWHFNGHCHCWNDAVYNNMGRSLVAACSIGSVNTNQFNGTTYNPGFEILCLSNGIAGRIYYEFQTAAYIPLGPPDWAHPIPYIAAFEDVSGLLWQREKQVRGPLPEVSSISYGWDARYYYAYVNNFAMTIQLSLHNNQATHFELMTKTDEASTVCSFSGDGTNWINEPIYYTEEAYYTMPIPESLRSLPTIYFKANFPYGAEQLIGWALSSTNPGPYVTYPQLNPVADQSAVAGRLFSFTNTVVDPYSPPDVLTFSLLNAPPGATVDPATGVFSWRPPIEQAPTNVTISVKVADTAAVPMCSTQQFSIAVSRPMVPVLASPTWSNFTYNFTLSGDTGLAYTVWASTNLLNWDPLWTSNLSAAAFLFSDTNSPAFPLRFYRATVGPSADPTNPPGP